MQYSYNVFTGNLDIVGSGGGSGASWKDPVANFAALPVSSNTDGDARITLDTENIYVWDSGSSTWKLSGQLSFANVGSSSNAQAASISGSVVTLQPANGTNPGLVTSGVQTIGGNKTFTGSITASNLSGTNTGDQTITLTGDVTGSGTSSFATTITPNTIVDSMVNTNAAIALSKLAALNNNIVPITNGSGIITNSSVTTTELGYVSGVTSAIQTQLNGKWSKVGNAGTIAGTNFVGTTDAVGLSIKTNSTEAILIDASQHVGFNQTNPTSNLHVKALDNSIAESVTFEAAGVGVNRIWKHYINDSNGTYTLYNPNQNYSALNALASPGLLSTGTQAPRYKFDVNAAALDTDPSTALNGSYGGAVSTIRNVNATVGNFSAITFEGACGDVTKAVDSTIVGVHDTHTTTPTGHLSFQTRLNGTLAERLSLDGIGGIFSGTISASNLSGTNTGDTASPGDLNETSFSISNNTSSPTNVTAFNFNNATARSIVSLVSATIDATSDFYEEFELKAIQRASDWVLNIQSIGDNSGIIFTITNTGQIQYTCNNYAGFVNGIIKFRAITTSV